MSETRVEEIRRLQREIAERQARLQYLLCGDQREGAFARQEWHWHYDSRGYCDNPARGY